MGIAEVFAAGGMVMYLILITSVAVAVIGIERLVLYNYAADNIDDFLENLKEILRTQELSAAANFCHKEKNLAAKVALAGIAAALNGDNAELALDNAYTSAAMNLRDRLNYLSMIVTLSPLLGLLGTIFGMIDAFNIFSVQAGQTLAITGGIGEALIATATGLCVAIFALLVHTYFAQKLDEMLTKLELTINLVLSKVGGKNETP